jgi:hypothetical protein
VNCFLPEKLTLHRIFFLQICRLYFGRKALKQNFISANNGYSCGGEVAQLYEFGFCENKPLEIPILFVHYCTVGWVDF